jgi:hypothetical protein
VEDSEAEGMAEQMVIDMNESIEAILDDPSHTKRARGAELELKSLPSVHGRQQLGWLRLLAIQSRLAGQASGPEWDRARGGEPGKWAATRLPPEQSIQPTGRNYACRVSPS